MIMKKTPILLLGLVTGTFALQSCVDNNYDLDDIDMTLGTSADITLPSSGTSDILLRNIMDLEDDGVVQFIKDSNGDSIFAVIQDGKADVEDINIGRVEIDNVTFQGIEATVNLDKILNPGSASAFKAPKKKVTINVGGMPITINQEYEYVIKSGEAHSDFKQNAGTVSCDVRRIDNITLQEATATLNLTIGRAPSWLKQVYLDNFVLYLPSDLHVASARFIGDSSPIATDNITDGKIILTSYGYIWDISKALQLEITFDKINNTGKNFKFTPNENPDKDGELTVDGQFEVQGTFRFGTGDSDVDGAALAAEIATITDPADLAKIMAGDISPLMPKSIDFNGPTSFKNNKISVKAVSGKVRHAVTAIEPIKLDDLPDFLNHDDVVLDLSNPVILLKATHALPAAAQTGLTLTSTVKGTTHTVTAPSISIPGNNVTTAYYIADKEADKQMFPEGYKTATKQVHTGKVKDLIEKIPEEIIVGVEPVELEVTDFDITNPYKVDIEYEVFAPMYIGKDMKLVYTDTDRGWGKDLDDLEDLNFENIILKADVDSDLPADIILTLKAIDEDAQEINAITVNSETVPAKAKDHPITLKLEPAAGHTINDALAGKNGVKRLDGIQYEAQIKGNADFDGTALPKNAKIKLKNIKVTIKGNVTYDAN